MRLLFDENLSPRLARLLADLPSDQRRKVLCGARHFGSRQLGEPGALEDVEYRLASSLSDLS